MNRRAFDTRGNLADQIFRFLETPFSDVLERHTVPVTKVKLQDIGIGLNLQRVQNYFLFGRLEPQEVGSLLAGRGIPRVLDTPPAEPVGHFRPSGR